MVSNDFRWIFRGFPDISRQTIAWPGPLLNNAGVALEKIKTVTCLSNDAVKKKNREIITVGETYGHNDERIMFYKIVHRVIELFGIFFL